MKTTALNLSVVMQGGCRRREASGEANGTACSEGREHKLKGQYHAPKLSVVVQGGSGGKAVVGEGGGAACAGGRGARARRPA